MNCRAGVAVQHRHRWWLLVEGVPGIQAGIIVFFWPGMTALVLLYCIAFWALFTGILELAFCAAPWKVLPGNWLWLLCGILSILLGAVMIANPGTGALAVVFFIAAYLMVFGVALLALSVGLKGMRLSAA